MPIVVKKKRKTEEDEEIPEIVLEVETPEVHSTEEFEKLIEPIQWRQSGYSSRKYEEITRPTGDLTNFFKQFGTSQDPMSLFYRMILYKNYVYQLRQSGWLVRYPLSAKKKRDRELIEQNVIEIK